MDSTEPSHNPKLKPYNNYLKYSSLGLQLLAAIGIAGWGGYKLDQYLQWKFPAFMLLSGFIAFGGMIYQIYKSVMKDQ